ncbi:MAG: PorV/PorQ family protein [Candidatus Kapaibacterium sp.]
MKRIIILLLTLPLLTLSAVESDRVFSASNAQDFKKVGADGGQFLKIGVGARGTGMAGAFSALTNDLTALHYNPAGINEQEGVTTNFSYTSWFGGFSHNFAAVAFPISSQYKIAVSMVNFTTGDVEETTLLQDQGTGRNYSVDDLSLQMTFAGKLTEQFSFGITAKYVQLAFADVSSGGLAIDVGTQYDTGIEGIKFGFSVHNLGTDHAYSGEGLSDRNKVNDFIQTLPKDLEYTAYRFSLPLMFRVGFAKEILSDEMNQLDAAFDFVASSDSPEQYVFGLEYSWNDLVFVRGGYLVGHDQLGLAGGVGLNYNSGGFNGALDYSINPTADIGLINRFTIGLDF